MANVTIQIPTLSDAQPPTPTQMYTNGYQLAKDIDRVNRKAGKPTNYAAYIRKTYGHIFGGK